MSDPEAAPHASSRLTRGTLLGRNVILNLAGSVVPGVAFLIAVPLLVRALGDERFGVLTLAWTALGYFSVFDLGVGHALTQAVADRLGAGKDDEVGSVVWTSLWTVVPIGAAAGAIVFLLAPWLGGVLKLSPELRAEATTTFRVLALAVPFAAASGALRGALQAHQYFGLVNAFRIPLALITFLGPLVTLPFTRSLVPAVLVLSIGRALLTLANYVAVVRVLPSVRDSRRTLDRGLARELLRVGGWMQVSHVVSPLMVTLDRFVIGAILGVGMVSYYAAPQELATKLWLFNVAAVPVFFSAVSATSTRDANRTVLMFDKLLRIIIAVLFLPTLVLVALAPEILRVWLGAPFEAASTLVMQLFAVAVFVNCLAQAAMGVIWGLGRPDLTAKVHLLELPLFGALLIILLDRFGLAGAAIAWSVRHIVDAGVLLVVTGRLLPPSRAPIGRAVAWTFATCAVFAVATVVSSPAARVTLLALTVPVWIVACWRLLITAEERTLPLRSLIAVLRPERA